jgi:hypothetical protein
VPGSEKASEQVRLHESETVVERGHRKVIWFIRGERRWQPATGWPGAVIDQEEPGPGTVWARNVGVRLDVGRMVMRVDSRPATHAARDVLDYLRRETRLAERATQRSYYRVAIRGELERLPSDTPLDPPRRDSKP